MCQKGRSGELEALLSKLPSMTFSANDRIKHDVFGLGTIQEIDIRHTSIDFDQDGPKKFITNMLRMEKSNVPAPPPPVKAPSKSRSRAKPKK
jgi:hypothetical protein